MKLYPSLMCINFMDLKEELEKLNCTNIKGYHIDIMDGHFVPNFSLGTNDIKAISSLTEKELDLHLMAEDADNFVDYFIELPIHRLCFHVETCTHLDRTLRKITSKGIKAGVAINPSTSIEDIKYVLEFVDFVLVMSVNPGFAGQAYIKYSTEKIKELVEFREKYDLNFEIEVDGAMSKERIIELNKLGADSFVLGTSALFGKGREYTELVDELIKGE